jgi:peptidoglycan/xylan/chitin deacetylase (PgdA/CDA1 family)
MRAEGIASPRLAWRGAGIPGVLSLFQNLETTVVPTPQGWRVAEGGPLDPAAPVIPPRQVAPRVLRVPILMYHRISSAPPAPSQAGLTITDPDFAAQLAYLKGHGYHTVLLVDLFNALYDGRPLPPHPVVLTFDDGYLDGYTDAFPLLRRYGMVGEFNIITGLVGETIGVNQYMTWPQVVAMAGAGMEMEPHTSDHQDLGIITAPQDAYELRFWHAVLAAHLHRAVQFLAYPSGEPFRSGTVVAQQRLLALLPQFGYVGALLDPPTPSTLQDARTPYQLPRVRVDPRESLAVFAARLQS